MPNRTFCDPGTGILSSKEDTDDEANTRAWRKAVVLGERQQTGLDRHARTGLGSGVFEVVNYFNKDAYRAAYVVRFEKAIYVLHCLQKKSLSGSRTAKTDMDLIERRLKATKIDYEVRYGKAKQTR